MPVYPIYQAPNTKGVYFAAALLDYFVNVLGCENPLSGVYVSDSLLARKRDFDRIFKDVLGIFDDPVSGIDVFYKHGEFDFEPGISRYKFFDKANFCFYLSSEEFFIELDHQGLHHFTTRAFAYYGSDADIFITNPHHKHLRVFFVVGTESDSRILTVLGEGFSIIKVGSLLIEGGGTLELAAGDDMELEADPQRKKVVIHCRGGGGGGGRVDAISRVRVGNTVFEARGEDELEMVAGSGMQLFLNPAAHRLEFSSNPNRFSHVKVGEEVLSAVAGDTLELRAGSNISLQLDRQSKAVIVSVSESVSDLVLECETVVLGPQNIDNRYVDLAYDPVYPTEVLLFVNGGGSQQIGVDYDVSGNRVSWADRQLDGVLEAGDVLSIVYQRAN
ncbi:MAG: hypothetical protein QW835_00295 [Candidatus Hadarchaeum sp.]